jgi:hypothetical protein
MFCISPPTTFKGVKKGTIEMKLQDIAAGRVSDIIKNYDSTRFEELTEAINSDEYNLYLLAECKKRAIELIRTGDFAIVIYGLKRHRAELRHFVPCIIPMTKEQFDKSELFNARVLAVHKKGRYK